MSVPPDRWRCAKCQANNMLNVQQCFRCHALRTAAPPSHPVSPHAQGAPLRQTTDVCAVLAGAFAVLSLWVLPLIFGSAGFVLGTVSLARLKENPHLKGKGQALIGVILGAIGVLWWYIQTQHQG
jgi:hypothetical protein